MILCRRLGFAVVLIPRSGSTAIAAACRRALKPGEVLRNKHPTATVMAGHLHDLRVIAVHRNPWARAYSEWCLYQREAAHLDNLPMSWRNEVSKWADISLEDFVLRKHIQRHGQQQLPCMWSQYCHAPNGMELVTEPWPFEELPRRWSDFAAQNHLPELKQTNAASRGDYREVFTPQLRDEIGVWAEWEIQRFGYCFDRGEHMLQEAVLHSPVLEQES